LCRFREFRIIPRLWIWIWRKFLFMPFRVGWDYQCLKKLFMISCQTLSPCYYRTFLCSCFAHLFLNTNHTCQLKCISNLSMGKIRSPCHNSMIWVPNVMKPRPKVGDDVGRMRKSVYLFAKNNSISNSSNPSLHIWNEKSYLPFI